MSKLLIVQRLFSRFSFVTLIKVLVISGLSSLGSFTLAQDKEVITMETTVTGNQEQPKVLYIVPWKEATDTTILSLPVTSKMNDVFDHVDRAEHQRHIRFVESLSGVDEP